MNFIGCFTFLNLHHVAPGQRVLILDELEDVECLEGDTVTFKCRICPSDYTGVKWYLDETLLYTNELNEIQMVPGGYHTLTFRQLARKDTGTISFAAGDKRSYASLLVRGESLPTAESYHLLLDIFHLVALWFSSLRGTREASNHH